MQAQYLSIMDFRALIIECGSLRNALRHLPTGANFDDCGKLTPKVIQLLEIVVAAESELLSRRSRSADKSKISEAKVAEIKRLLKERMPVGEIAKQTGISRPTIYRMIKG